MIDFASGTIISDNGESLVVHVKDQVLTLYMRDYDALLPRFKEEQTMTARPIRPMSPLDDKIDER